MTFKVKITQTHSLTIELSLCFLSFSLLFVCVLVATILCACKTAHDCKLRERTQRKTTSGHRRCFCVRGRSSMLLFRLLLPVSFIINLCSTERQRERSIPHGLQISQFGIGVRFIEAVLVLRGSFGETAVSIRRHSSLCRSWYCSRLL